MVQASVQEARVGEHGRVGPGDLPVTTSTLCYLLGNCGPGGGPATGRGSSRPGVGAVSETVRLEHRETVLAAPGRHPRRNKMPLAASRPASLSLIGRRRRDPCWLEAAAARGSRAARGGGALGAPRPALGPGGLGPLQRRLAAAVATHRPLRRALLGCFSPHTPPPPPSPECPPTPPSSLQPGLLYSRPSAPKRKSWGGDPEPRPKKGDWGEVFREATCHSSLAPCNTGFAVRVKAHARTHARTHTPGSPDHALLALRPSALPPVKTQRSTLPSLLAPGREQALQLTSNLANEKLTSYRQGGAITATEP
uniref:Uncharacterized protein n=1 Tax=Rangifer tarandus platyrhynchus TaxID=3082113 RepID=A0ACB0DU91_RANTA|nr:unnamed protein product [Rangifer tarandus platyrhynchus]